MLICIDFDDTIVSQAGRDYADVESPLKFMPNAKQALHALKKAGHALILFSGRANRALREDPNLNPMVRAGVKKIDRTRWEASQKINQARYEQMITFVEKELPGIFSAIDDGMQGKPSCDMFLDDKALRFGHGNVAMTWDVIASVYGEPVYERVG